MSDGPGYYGTDAADNGNAAAVEDAGTFAEHVKRVVNPAPVEVSTVETVPLAD